MQRLVLAVFLVACRSQSEAHATPDAAAAAFAVTSASGVTVEVAPNKEKHKRSFEELLADRKRMDEESLAAKRRALPPRPRADSRNEADRQLPFFVDAGSDDTTSDAYDSRRAFAHP